MARVRIGLAGLALLVAAVGCDVGIPGTSSQTIGSPSPVSAAKLQSGHWSTLPPAPIEPRDGPSTVWSGRELLIWGGSIYPSATPLGDGAAYDPTTRRWRKLPHSPLSARQYQTTIWTGTEMIVWGGAGNTTSLSDGAAYNPTSNQWRMLPQGPLLARVGVVGAWTGSEVFLLGGLYGSGQHYTDGAAFDPRSGRWRAIPPAIPPEGHPLVWKAAAYINGQVLAWSEWATSTQIASNSYSLAGGADLFSYSIESGTWRVIPASESALPDIEEVLVANRLVIVRGGPVHCGFSCPPLAEATAIYDPLTMAWTRLPADPLAVDHLSSAWTGAALFSYNTEGTLNNIPPGNASAYDAADRQWVGLPTAPYGCASYPTNWLWTARAVLLYCSRSLPASTAISGLEFSAP